jgi:hypothetical protein
MSAPSSIARTSALLLLLPAGAVVLFLLSGMTKHRYDDTGFGSFHGLVKTRVFYFGSNHSFSVAIEGRSSARWCWVRPTNYQYEALSFDWFGEDRVGRGEIDTFSMILNTDSNSVPVSNASLSDLLFGVSPAGLHQQDVEAIGFVKRLIVEAGEGRLAPPRHHYYDFKTPVSGMMAHFSLGSRFPYSLYWWTGAWCVLCLWIAARAWARQVPKGAAPNGGLATRLGNSGVTEGPPSVS